jgi:hypothetical protein
MTESQPTRNNLPQGTPIKNYKYILFKGLANWLQNLVLKKLGKITCKVMVIKLQSLIRKFILLHFYLRKLSALIRTGIIVLQQYTKILIKLQHSI